jgi:hypothetical protein
MSHRCTRRSRLYHESYARYVSAWAIFAQHMLILAVDVINTLTFSPFAAGPITMDHENTVKSYAASPGMLGRGHTLLEPLGPVWDIHASEYHPQLAVAAADGTCSTTNTLRSPRRGGTVVCLSLASAIKQSLNPCTSPSSCTGSTRWTTAARRINTGCSTASSPRYFMPAIHHSVDSDKPFRRSLMPARQSKTPRKAMGPSPRTRVHGPRTSASIVFDGTTETGLQQAASWHPRQLQGFVELMCCGEGGSRINCRTVGSSRLGWRMGTQWTWTAGCPTWNRWRTHRNMPPIPASKAPTARHMSIGPSLAPHREYIRFHSFIVLPPHPVLSVPTEEPSLSPRPPLARLGIADAPHDIGF